MTDLSPASSASGPRIAMRAADKRARMIDAVADLCQAAPRDRTPAADRALADTLLKLVSDAEQTVRRRLAERLAQADWAPHDLVAALALDEIEVARPLLAQSPLLSDADLLNVLAVGGVEHRVAVARRPRLSAAVADRASADGEPMVLAALVCNEHVELPLPALRRLMAAARRSAELRVPLARRRELDPELAMELYAFVGEALRETLAKRFPLPSERWRAAVDQAVADAAAPSQGPEREEMEGRLVEKLQASGRLRPGFLVKSLREERLGLFEIALASLCEAPRNTVAAAIRAASPERLALACAAAGLDRGAFPTVLSLVRRLTGGQPGDAAEGGALVKAAFARSDAAAARGRFLASPVE